MRRFAFAFLLFRPLVRSAASDDGGDVGGSGGAETTNGSGGAGGTEAQAGGGPTTPPVRAGTGGAQAGGAAGKGGTGTGGGGTAGTQNKGGSAGSGGTGGSAGSGGNGPPPTILACGDVLPGSGWQAITPPGGLGYTQAIALDPFNVGTIYTQMHKGGNGAHFPTDGIYKSTDCGSTWNKLPPGRNARDNTQGEVNIHSGSIVSIIVDPVEKGVMYTANNYGPPGIYKSTNGGVDWDNVIPEDLKQYMEYGGWFNALSVDPSDRLHLVGATHTGCKGKYAPNCLAETRDGGQTWRLIVVPATGNEQCGVFVHDATTLMYASPQNGAYLTTNGSADVPTWTKVASGAHGEDTGLQPYKAADGKYYIASDYGVLIGSPHFQELDGRQPIAEAPEFHHRRRARSLCVEPSGNVLHDEGGQPGQLDRVQGRRRATQRRRQMAGVRGNASLALFVELGRRSRPVPTRDAVRGDQDISGLNPPHYFPEFARLQSAIERHGACSAPRMPNFIRFIGIGVVSGSIAWALPRRARCRGARPPRARPVCRRSR